MSRDDFDAIVIGARCAGSPTAMLLAQKGYRVLLVDRATFPSDTVSTHVIHPQGVATLARWGLLDRLVATGCPPIHTYLADFGPVAISGRPGTEDAPVAYCPRRLVLDKLLVDAAVEAGAELREGFSVEELLRVDGRVTGIAGHGKDGRSVEVRAPIVIGADGRYSYVARAVEAEIYNERPTGQVACYGYWSGLPTHGRFEIYLGDRTGCGVVETHDGLTVGFGGWPFNDDDAKGRDRDARFRALFEQSPLRERMRGATLVSKIVGVATPNFMRKPFGPGWALVGDAGYVKDPCTAQGIVDSFRDAELVTAAVDAWRSGRASYDEAMATYQQTRDAQVLPMFDFTCQLATLEPPPPEMQQLLGAIRGNQPAMDGFMRVLAGITSPAEFFSPDHVGRMLAGTPQAAQC